MLLTQITPVKHGGGTIMRWVCFSTRSWKKTHLFKGQPSKRRGEIAAKDLRIPSLYYLGLWVSVENWVQSCSSSLQPSFQVDISLLPFFPQDYYADSKRNVHKDHVQNYKLLYARENHTHTTLAFSRKLQTCDPNDTEITVGEIYTQHLWGVAVDYFPRIQQKWLQNLV